jgi:hypothetical protein
VACDYRIDGAEGLQLHRLYRTHGVAPASRWRIRPEPASWRRAAARCNFLAGLAPSFFLLFLFRALLGIGMGAEWPAGAALAIDSGRSALAAGTRPHAPLPSFSAPAKVIPAV